VAEILEETKLTVLGEDGWRCRYRVRRNDGEEVVVDAACTRRAEAMAIASESSEALEFIADRGRSAAQRCAESAQSPARRGSVIVSIFVDPHSGALAIEYGYERL
jgi:hypothetical protein